MIAYFDTSVVLKLLVSDEPGVQGAAELWEKSTYVTCGAIGYVEARAGLAAAHRQSRLTTGDLRVATAGFEDLWSQVRIIAITPAVVRAAGNLAEREGLRGYDAVHLACGLAAQATVFATADERLLDAARRNGLAVTNPQSVKS